MLPIRSFFTTRYGSDQSQPLEENLQANENQDDTAQPFRTGLITQAEETADLDAHSRTDKGRQANTGRGVDDRNAHEGKGHAHCQGIDARSNGQEEHSTCGERRIFFFFATSLADHVSADEDENETGNPAVVAHDIGGKEAAQIVAYSRHEGLKAAEPGAGDEHMPDSCLP